MSSYTVGLWLTPPRLRTVLPLPNTGLHTPLCVLCLLAVQRQPYMLFVLPAYLCVRQSVSRGFIQKSINYRRNPPKYGVLS